MTEAMRGAIKVANLRADRATLRGEWAVAREHAADAALLANLARKGVTTPRHPAVAAARRDQALRIRGEA